MAEQPLAGPAPAPALVFTAREPSELLKQRYGENEEFLEVSYIPPSLAGAFAGGYKDTEVPETETHLNLAALDEILKSQPDQELRSHLSQGVNYFFPLRDQITCLAHLTTLSKCVSKVTKELDRLTELGWYRTSADLPYIPLVCTGQGGTSRKHENRWRRTTNHSAPHKTKLDSNGDEVKSFNAWSNELVLMLPDYAFLIQEYAGEAHVPDCFWKRLCLFVISRRRDGPSVSERKPYENQYAYWRTRWPKEEKPSVGGWMKNMAILKAIADASGEVLYMFADDFKTFSINSELRPTSDILQV